MQNLGYYTRKKINKKIQSENIIKPTASRGMERLSHTHSHYLNPRAFAKSYINLNITAKTPPTCLNWLFGTFIISLKATKRVYITRSWTARRQSLHCRYLFARTTVDSQIIKALDQFRIVVVDVLCASVWDPITNTPSR